MKVLKYMLLTALIMCSHSMMAMQALKDMQGRVAKMQLIEAQVEAEYTKKVKADLAERSPYKRWFDITTEAASDIQQLDNIIGMLRSRLTAESLSKEQQQEIEEEINKNVIKRKILAREALAIPRQSGENSEAVQSRLKIFQQYAPSAASSASASIGVVSTGDISKSLSKTTQSAEEIRKMNDFFERWGQRNPWETDPVERWLYIANEVEKHIKSLQDPQIQKIYACAILNLQRKGIDISNEAVKNKIKFFEQFASIPERVTFAFDRWKDEEVYKEKQGSDEQRQYLAIAANLKINEINLHKKAYLSSEAEDLKKEYARQALAISGNENLAVLRDVLEGTSSASAASTAPLSAEDQAIKQSVEKIFEMWAQNAVGSANEKWNHIVGSASQLIGKLERNLDLAENKRPEQRKKILKQQLQIAETALKLNRNNVTMTNEIEDLLQEINTAKEKALKNLQALQEK